MDEKKQLVYKLVKYVYKPNNPMWQDGLLRLGLDEQGKLKGTLFQFEFESEEEKAMMRPSEHIYELSINSEISEIFKELKYSLDIDWDTFVLEVDHNGNFLPHYELNGEEITFDFYSKDSTEYLISNLHSCLVANAPDNYEWVIVFIQKLKDNLGRASEAKCFFNQKGKTVEDLEPGDNIYIQNLTMKILDENRLGETSDWKKANIYIHKSGTVKYTVE